MSVRFTMSKALQKGEEMKGKAPPVEDFLHDSKRIRSKIRVSDLSDEMMLRRQFDFNTTRKLLGHVSESDQGMYLPYPDGEKQWVFLFRPPGKNQKPVSNRADDPGEFAMAFLATANYRIFFRGIDLPKIVVFSDLDGKRYQLRPTAFGDGMLIDCPLVLVFKGGVLTTSSQSKIDFRRTDRLLQYLKETTTAGDPSRKESGRESTKESTKEEPQVPQSEEPEIEEPEIEEPESTGRIHLDT
jgi:hypothetical protein